MLVEVLNRGDKGLFERAIRTPAGKELENTRVVDFRSAIRVFVNRHFFPLHPGVEHFENGVEGLVITQLAVRTTLGQREMRSDKLFKLGRTQLHGNYVVIGHGDTFGLFTQHLVSSSDKDSDLCLNPYHYRTLSIWQNLQPVQLDDQTE
jgi:hypothetical protein